MFDTPLRYPGGKGRLAQYVCDLINMNDLVGGHYAEPYAGGAGIAFPLMYLEYVSHIHLNDLNRSVFAFWKSVCEQPGALCRLIRDKKPTMAEWRRQKAIQSATDPTMLELGFSTFFLNRTNRSGIILGGVIGGKKQTGKWKIGARYKTKELIGRIEKIASFAPRISLYNLDASDFIKEYVSRLPANSLVYLDPPYYVQGRFLYEDHYQPDDHANLARLVSSIKQKWIVSYDNVAPIKQLYSGYRREIFGLRYSAQHRYAGTEVMIFCPNLKRPKAIEAWRGIAA
jgi:DNA adenine methylase